MSRVTKKDFQEIMAGLGLVDPVRLAERLGVSRQALHKWMSGKTLIGFEWAYCVLRLCRREGLNEVGDRIESRLNAECQKRAGGGT